MRNWFKNLDRQTMRVILALAWPTMLEQLMQTAGWLADRRHGERLGRGLFVLYRKGLRRR